MVYANLPFRVLVKFLFRVLPHLFLPEHGNGIGNGIQSENTYNNKR